MHGARYVALIAEELTFEVLNLFPDYTYPGKIVGTDVQVVGPAKRRQRIHTDGPRCTAMTLLKTARSAVKCGL